MILLYFILSGIWLIFQLAKLMKEKFQSYEKISVSYLNWSFVNILCFLYNSNDKNATKYFYPINSNIKYYDETELFCYLFIPILILYFFKQYRINYPKPIGKNDIHKISSNLILSFKKIIIDFSKIITANLSSYYKFITEKINYFLSQIKIKIPNILKFWSIASVIFIIAFSIIILIQIWNENKLEKFYLKSKTDYKEIIKYKDIGYCSMQLQSKYEDDSLRYKLTMQYCDSNYLYNKIEVDNFFIFNLHFLTKNNIPIETDLKKIKYKTKYTKKNTISGCSYEGSIKIKLKDYEQINDWMIEIKEYSDYYNSRKYGIQIYNPRSINSN